MMCIDEPNPCSCDEPVQSLPVLGDPAPDFEVLTTHGPLKLSDYRGRWVVLFSHPADFTPVCTTEFMAFAGIADELAAMNAQLLGLSVDSVPAHLAWVRAIREKMGVDIPFPIIADLEMKVAKRYGMIQPGMSTTACVRAVFVIDDKGVLRAMIYYPLTTGRSMPEILRLVKALQTTDAHGVSTPANWQPGDKVVVPAPKTVEEMKKRDAEGLECRDWYLCFKDL
jgi:peroxiredoxin (alkyl hydroperoxide reductase subunit C)